MYKQALEDYQKILPEFRLLLSQQAQFNYYDNRGEAEISLLLYNAAILSYTNALEIRQRPDIFFLRGVAYSATYQNDLAKQDWNKVLNMCRLDQSPLCEGLIPRAKLALSDLSKIETIMHR